MGIKICPKCNGKVSTTRNICIHCGYVFPSSKICPDCGEAVDINTLECPVCGYLFNSHTVSGNNDAAEITSSNVEKINSENLNTVKVQNQSVDKQVSVPDIDNKINSDTKIVSKNVLENDKISTKIEEKSSNKLTNEIGNKDINFENKIDNSSASYDAKTKLASQEVTDPKIKESTKNTTISNNDVKVANNILEEKDVDLSKKENVAEETIKNSSFKENNDFVSKNIAVESVDNTVVVAPVVGLSTEKSDNSLNNTEISNNFENTETSECIKTPGNFDLQKENNDLDTLNLNNNVSSIKCPYCGSNSLGEIGINFFICNECKNKFPNIFDDFVFNGESNPNSEVSLNNAENENADIPVVPVFASTEKAEDVSSKENTVDEANNAIESTKTEDIKIEKFENSQENSTKIKELNENLESKEAQNVDEIAPSIDNTMAVGASLPNENAINGNLSENQNIEISESNQMPLTCPYCGSVEINECGIESYFCNTCKGRFLNNSDAVFSTGNSSNLILENTNSNNNIIDKANTSSEMPLPSFNNEEINHNDSKKIQDEVKIEDNSSETLDLKEEKNETENNISIESSNNGNRTAEKINEDKNISTDSDTVADDLSENDGSIDEETGDNKKIQKIKEKTEGDSKKKKITSIIVGSSALLVICACIVIVIYSFNVSPRKKLYDEAVAIINSSSADNTQLSDAKSTLSSLNFMDSSVQASYAEARINFNKALTDSKNEDYSSSVEDLTMGIYLLNNNKGKIFANCRVNSEYNVSFPKNFTYISTLNEVAPEYNTDSLKFLGWSLESYSFNKNDVSLNLRAMFNMLTYL